MKSGVLCTIVLCAFLAASSAAAVDILDPCAKNPCLNKSTACQKQPNGGFKCVPINFKAASQASAANSAAVTKPTKPANNKASKPTKPSKPSKPANNKPPTPTKPVKPAGKDACASNPCWNKSTHCVAGGPKGYTCERIQFGKPKARFAAVDAEDDAADESEDADEADAEDEDETEDEDEAEADEEEEEEADE